MNGDVSKRDALIKAMETAKIDSPRGPFALSKAHNPVQDFYLRKVEGKENKAIGVAIKGLADPARRLQDVTTRRAAARLPHSSGCGAPGLRDPAALPLVARSRKVTQVARVTGIHR